MVKGILCSTGALITRFNGRDPRLLFEILPRIEADGIEFMIYPSWDGQLDEVAKTMLALKNGGVNIPVLHADKRIGELLSRAGEGDFEEALARFETGCRIAEELEAHTMVLHLWGGVGSDRHIDGNISVLGDYMRLAERHGVLLTVENVVCGGKTPLYHIKRIMREYPDARFTIDTKMAEFHRENPATLACGELWQGRAAHLHVNDYGGGVRDFSDLRVLHPGDGHVDFGPFFEKVRGCGYSGFATVESTSVRPDGSIDYQKLNRSLEFVRRGLCSQL